MTRDPKTETAVRAEVTRWLARNWRQDLSLGDWWAMLAAAGFGFPSWPTGLGGRNLSRSDVKAVAEEVAAAGAPGPPGGVGQMVGAPILLEYGTEQQRQRWLPGLAKGAESWCQLFSEPEAGSDLANLRTRAEWTGNGWVLNGQKLWSREADHADRGLTLARTDPAVPKREGITYFVVDLEQPGVTVRPIVQMNGRSNFNEVFLTDVFVPPENLIGELGQGWRLAQASLSYEREEVGGGSVLNPTRIAQPGARNGMLQRAIPELVEAHRAAEHDRPAVRLSRAHEAMTELARRVDRSADPILRQRLARLHALARANRFRTFRVRAASRRGAKPGPEVSIGKLMSSTLGNRARDTGFSVLSDEGALTGPDTESNGAVQRLALSVPSLSIAGGTDEIQRNLIGERVLGLPREVDSDRDVPFNRRRVDGQPD